MLSEFNTLLLDNHIKVLKNTVKSNLSDSFPLKSILSDSCSELQAIALELSPHHFIDDTYVGLHNFHNLS